MKKLLCSLALLTLLPGCGHEPPPKKLDPNAGKHKLADSDPRTWHTYPLLLLVATKHQVGVDTLAQLVKSFDKRFQGMNVDYDPQLPTLYNSYEEDAAPISGDVAYFVQEGQRYGLSSSVVAELIADFYLNGASSRDYPDCTNNQ